MRKRREIEKGWMNDHSRDDDMGLGDQNERETVKEDGNSQQKEFKHTFMHGQCVCVYFCVCLLGYTHHDGSNTPWDGIDRQTGERERESLFHADLPGDEGSRICTKRTHRETSNCETESERRERI